MPFVALIGYQYLFNGPATLTEIPEGYEPRSHEYIRVRINSNCIFLFSIVKVDIGRYIVNRTLDIVSINFLILVSLIICYVKNPVRRFLAKNFFETPERSYEEHLHFVYKEQCKQKMRLVTSFYYQNKTDQ